MGAAMRVCDRLSSLTYLRRDSEGDKYLKRTLLPISLAGAALYGSFLGAVTEMEDTDDVATLAGTLTILLFPAAFWLSGRRWAELAVVAHVAVLLSRDITLAAQVRARCWSIAVILVDVTLVARSREWVVAVVIGAVLFEIWLVAAEDLFSYGLYDAARFGNKDDPVEVCNCADPPCTTTVTATAADGVSITVVFLLDYYVTRRFAVTMRQQMALVSASVATCDEITDSLARYEVEAATKTLDGSSGEQLPPALRKSYRRLLTNLDSYKPYLPDSLLLEDSVCDGSAAVDASPVTEARAPGEDLVEADVCIVFTDVQSSTELWEEFHHGMYTGLQQHNAVLRSVAAAHRGYEVKTIGDAFMLAFEDVRSGVAFAVAAQRQLAAAEWPSDLLQSPLCQRVASSDGEVLWHGLRVRIGVHFGSVRVERNPVTGRCDYFGPPVNIAARIESEIRYGGLVGISDDVERMLGTDGIEALGAVARPLGTRRLKGVASPTLLHAVLPVEMQDRILLVDDTPAREMTEPKREYTAEEPRVGTLVRRTSAISAMSMDSVDGQNARLALTLRRTVASSAAVTTVITDEATHRVPQLVTAVERAADVSQGVLQSVLSATCVVTWNAPRACAGHAAQCGHFLSEVQRYCDSFRMRSHAGAGSGTVLSGNLAGRRRRFATVIGGCVELATALAAAAHLRDARALVVGLVAAHCTTRSAGSVRVGAGILAVQQVDDSDPSEQDTQESFPELPHLWGIGAEDSSPSHPSVVRPGSEVRLLSLPA